MILDSSQRLAHSLTIQEAPSCYREDLVQRPRPIRRRCALWEVVKHSILNGSGSMQRGGRETVRARGDRWHQGNSVVLTQDWHMYLPETERVDTGPAQAQTRQGPSAERQRQTWALSLQSSWAAMCKQCHSLPQWCLAGHTDHACGLAHTQQYMPPQNGTSETFSLILLCLGIFWSYVRVLLCTFVSICCDFSLSYLFWFAW